MNTAEPDCIIVLAHEMDIEGNLNPESVSRIELACNTYFNHPSATLITCGWDYRKDCSLLIAEVMKEYAVRLGVPAKKILTEIHSRDTVGDAFFIKINIAEPLHWKQIVVVTSDYHAARTERIFKFIYGPDYTINVIGAKVSDAVEKHLSEQASAAAFNLTFEHITEGDTRGIYERLSTRHPFYNGDIYPKILLDF